MSLLIGFRFSYDDWGSMITIFFTIASAFIQIDAAKDTKSFTTGFTQMHERMLNDQQLSHVLKRLDHILARKVKDPVNIEGKFFVFLLQTFATDPPDRRRQNPLQAQNAGTFFGLPF